MPRDPEEGGSGGGQNPTDNIIAWLNGLKRKNVPHFLNKLRNEQGLFDRHFLSDHPNLGDRIREAYRSRKEPGLAFADWNPNDDIGGGGGSDAGSDSGPSGGGGGTGGPGGGSDGSRNRGAGGGGGGRDGGGSNGLSMAELAADYGWSLAFLNSNKELKALFQEAVKRTWSPERFVAELRDTKWFQEHSATQRQFMVNRIVDPETWQQDLERVTAHTNNVWGQLFGTNLSPKMAERWGIRAMKFGWTDEQIADHMIQTTNFQKLLKKKTAGGTAMQTKNQILQMAQSYGVGTGDKWMARQVEDVLAGNDTIDGVMNQLKERAKSKYVAFADQLDAGKTMDEIADPYRQAMANLLEMNPNQIDINAPLINRALTNRAKEGYRPLSIAEFEDVVRKDKRWMRTDNARDQFEQVGYGLLSSWGLI